MTSIDLTSITGSISTPYLIQACDVYGYNCVLIATIGTTVPPSNTILLPPQFNTAPAVGIKIIDFSGCEIFKTFNCNELPGGCDSIVLLSSIPVDYQVDEMTYVPTNNYVYGCYRNNDAITVINTLTDSVVTTINVGNGPISSTYNPDNSYLYVLNTGSSDITVIDTATNSIVTTIVGLGEPLNSYYNSINQKLYVCNGGSPYMSVIYTLTNTISFNITMPFPDNLVFCPINQYLYVVGGSFSGIYVVDTTTDTIFTYISDVSFYHIIYSPINSLIYSLSNGFTNKVTIIDPISNTIVTSISVGNGPSSIVYTPSYIYVTNRDDNTITAIDTTTNLDTIIYVGNGPTNTIYNPYKNYLYI